MCTEIKIKCIRHQPIRICRNKNVELSAYVCLEDINRCLEIDDFCE